MFHKCETEGGGQRPHGPRLMFIAGENSGDQHAARLIHELKTRQPGIECFGFGGDHMEREGMRLDVNLAQKLPLIGLSQVIRNYGKLKKLFEKAGRMLREENPDALILVDYPGFNLRIAEVAKRAGVPVVYYISPQIWAWRRERLATIARTVRHMMVIFPFEEEIYRSAGVPVTYVGHPLCDHPEVPAPREETLRRLGVNPGTRIIGLQPGSRKGEVVRLLPEMLGAARIIQRSLPSVRFVLPRASTVSRALINKYTSRVPDVQVQVVESDLTSVRSVMDFAICKSGTSTLELALLDVPMIVVYKASLPSYLFYKTLVTLPWVGLVNIIPNETVVPELLQEDANAGRMAGTVLGLMNDARAITRMRGKFAEIRASLAGSGAAAKAAETVLQVLGPHSSPI
jgi:lipid-A-disaccharide synthase